MSAGEAGPRGRRDEIVIRVTGLTKAYGENTIFENLSFFVPENTSLAICGESGCGKTTLLRLIAGLDDSYEGEIRIEGRVMSAGIPPFARDIACVFQEATLWNHMTVYKNIAYGMKEKNRERKSEKVLEIARRLQIEEYLDRYPAEISGGQAKRVSLARAFASGRRILLLDEPLSNIDDATKAKVLDYIREFYCGGRTILYVTHDMSEAKALGCKAMTLSRRKPVSGSQAVNP